MDGLTDLERKVIAFLDGATGGGWFGARQIADYSGVFANLTNRSKAGAMTAVLKRLREAGLVEWDRSEPPIIWRRVRDC